MQLFPTYSLYPITVESAHGTTVYDQEGNAYLDFYGGHGVISLGHSHPKFVSAIQEQLSKISFYSNSVILPLQEQFAALLGELSGCHNYQLFFCNSGTESNEHALTLALEHTSRKKVVAFENAFHGRTMGAAHATSTAKQNGKLFSNEFIDIVALNEIEPIYQLLKSEQYAAVIIEGIQGVGGLDMPTDTFLRQLSDVCKQFGTLLILDEVQSGYGRTGKFFAHQHSGIQPDLITMAKGMGNGFPIGGVLIHPDIQAKPGLLGTTFGGNPLACAAGISVLKGLKEEQLIGNAQVMGEKLVQFFTQEFPEINLKGKGLMFGLEFNGPVAEFRKKLLLQEHIFTGNAAHPNVLRLLPPLSINESELDQFFYAFQSLYHAEFSIHS